MICLRAATEVDASQCAAIYGPFVTDTWISFETEPPGEADMARRIADCSHSHAWLVAESNGAILGYAYGSAHRSRAAYASSADVTVYIAPGAQRAGLGRQLYAALFEALKAKDIHAVFAGIALPNEASVGLHRAMGFEPVGIYREVGWKFGAYRDVSWWQKRLD